MTSHRDFTISVIAAVISVIAMVVAASNLNRDMVALAAAAFATIVIASTLISNAKLWRSGSTSPIDALQTTTRFTALVYAWAAGAMLAIYLGTNVRWQHGWQYGTIFALIALAHAYYIKMLAARAPSVSAPSAVARAAQLALLQGTAAVLALAWMISIGKLSTPKGDWAANTIFVAGGVAIAVISAVIYRTHRHLTRQST